MKKILFFFLIVNAVFGQQKEIETFVNPNGNWFFGAEVGLNTIASYQFNENNNSVQGGLTAEYYFARHWSLVGRLKYFKTGLSFKNTKGYNVFNGAVLAIPVTIKWEFRIHKNFSGFAKAGFVLNQEVKSDYNYAGSPNAGYPKSFGSFNSGIGLNYFINKTTAVYVDFETYVLGNDRQDDDFLKLLPVSTNNQLINFGIKHNFKK